ncbi:hypothetical protein OH146_04030 [Salinibacterium sp. SYSU T00001]|uniref:hypothetical protein n=1 Tax=Homoserinimonas sedimenticola TaxID=2986805 RepID=UPI00223616B3|nr:hypothetical protein [Salinibacterium sedimenticola]MCW4384938.1 hypothetical protein [Salinibacterium sedimenticola]
MTETPETRKSSSVWYVVVATLLIAFIPVAGWIAGLVMVWFSGVWRLREKVVATAVAPVVVLVIVAAFQGELVATIGYLLSPLFLLVGAWLLVVGLHRTGELSSKKGAS